MSKYERLAVTEVAIPLVDSAQKGSMVSVSMTPASVAAATAAYQTLTLAGVSVGDAVLCVTDPINNATALVSARVTAANTVALQFVNPTAGALTPNPGTYVFLVIPQA
jgi:hypothetical protein